MYDSEGARLTDGKQSTSGLRVLTNVLDKHILLLPNRCESLGTVTFQAKDNGSSGDGRSHEGVVMTQVRFVIELVAGVTEKSQVD